MIYKKLIEQTDLIYNDDVEDFLNPDGTKKKWPYKPQIIDEKIKTLLKEKDKLEQKIKALNHLINISKNEKQKIALNYKIEILNSKIALINDKLR